MRGPSILAVSLRRGLRRPTLSRSRLGSLVIFLFLALLSAFMVLPAVYSFVQSIKPMEELFIYPPRFFVSRPTFENYLTALSLADNLWIPFSRYAFNSVFISGLGTFLYIFIASLAAYPLAKSKMPGKTVLSRIIVFTMLFNATATAIPQYIVMTKLQIIDTYLAAILPLMAQTVGVFLMQQFITSSLPDSTLEAARIDGASEFRIFFRIVMPSVKPGWLTLLIFTFQRYWSNSSPLIYSEELKQITSVLSSVAAGGIARAGAGAAVSILLMIPPLLIFIYSQSSVMETMSHSGLK